jgi:hypothetical protein
MHLVHDADDYWTILWILDHSFCMSFNSTSRFEKSSQCSRIHSVVGDNRCELISCLSIAFQSCCHSLLCQLDFSGCWLPWRSHRHPFLIQTSLIYIEHMLVWITTFINTFYFQTSWTSHELPWILDWLHDWSLSRLQNDLQFLLL